MKSIILNRRVIIAAAACSICLCATIPSRAQRGMGGSRGMGASGGPSTPKQTRRYRPPKFAPTGPPVRVAAVELTGQFSTSESRIRAKLQTRAGRRYDPESVTSDVRQLLASGFCYDVRTYKKPTPQGVIITFELFEQPTIKYIRFVGTKIREKTLLKKAEIAVGQPLNQYRVEESQRKLEEFFRERGNSLVRVNIQEGTKKGDQGVVFQV